MEPFRTIVEITASPDKISHTSNVMFLGSCFTENIGNRMAGLKFRTDINPFGIIYNPRSVANSLKILAENKTFTKQDLYFENERWFSFFHHSRFSSPGVDGCLEEINKRALYSSSFIKRADYLIITFGTAWVYLHRKTGITVSNCHKLPACEFDRVLLSAGEIVSDYERIISTLKDHNPALKIIFTLSPVRHWKDGAIDNQLSKSILTVAVHALKKKYSHVDYFPAYEIVMDDLRDYRFYAGDMLHPSQQAIDYIWDKFGMVYFGEETGGLIKEIDKLNKAMAHRPFNPEAGSYKKFLQANKEKTIELKNKYPYLDFEKELKFFSDN